jgi:hypothetical protein
VFVECCPKILAPCKIEIVSCRRFLSDSFREHKRQIVNASGCGH